MKNLNRHMITALLILVALSLAACDGVPGGVSIDELTAALDSPGTETGDQQAFSGSHSQEDLTSASSSGSPDVSASTPADELKLKGMIEAVTESTLTLNGESLNVATVEDLTALFQAGASYEIEYRLNEDGTISLVDFHLDDSLSDDHIKFKGMVEAVTDKTISFSGETYTVNTLENLTTLFEVGAFYEIEYRMNENDTISLIDFHLEDSSMDDDDDMVDDMDDDMDDDNYDDDDMDDDGDDDYDSYDDNSSSDNNDSNNSNDDNDSSNDNNDDDDDENDND